MGGSSKQDPSDRSPPLGGPLVGGDLGALSIETSDVKSSGQGYRFCQNFGDLKELQGSMPGHTFLCIRNHTLLMLPQVPD